MIASLSGRPCAASAQRDIRRQTDLGKITVQTFACLNGTALRVSALVVVPGYYRRCLCGLFNSETRVTRSLVGRIFAWRAEHPGSGSPVLRTSDALLHTSDRCSLRGGEKRIRNSRSSFKASLGKKQNRKNSFLYLFTNEKSEAD